MMRELKYAWKGWRQLYEFLKERDLDSFQGYYFGRPVPENEIVLQKLV